MKFYTFLSFVLLTIFCVKMRAQQPDHSLPFANAQNDAACSIKSKQNREFWKRAAVPSVFFGLSALSWHKREDVRTIRNRYIPDFNYQLDDYIQYVPAATVFALNLAGVKGRNRPVRAVINYGGSLMIMGGLVNALKYSIRVTRPDERANNSFPSGHTAMAFMNASFLHKEYGPVNSLYSTLGYAMSTYAGISRSLNNRHWLSDILAGAGVGILSTELSYLIVDKLYKNKGDFFSDFDARVELEKPSFLTIQMGPAFFLDIYSSQESGLEGALEGAYFFNKKWGVGAETCFMHIPFKEESLGPSEWDKLSEIVLNPSVGIQSLGLASFMAGVYYSKFLGTKLILQGKLLAGMGVGVGGNIGIRGRQNIDGKPQQMIEIPFMKYSLDKTWITGAGISITAMVAPTIGLSLSADYKYARPKMNISYYDEASIPTENIRLPINALSFGAGFVSFFSL
ncbi:MAG: phosphatase PAP2 family protein [Dysgonamonadaceae bacterium]|jgi:membrane-associated phospholipid phosphatase|nr:phosphatase PAP2 family protein [Dysgonamonadaceae bacterium]